MNRFEVVQFKQLSASAHLTVDFELKESRLANVFSEERQQGHATALMQSVIEYADDNELTVYLTARRYGHPIGPDNDVLVDLYKKFGFEIAAEYPGGAVGMTRTPTSQK